jgi:hypothetical protein
MVVPLMQSISGNNDGTYILYGPPHGRYARFAMLAMFGALAAEVQALLIGSHDFGGFGSATFESQALPHLLIPRFLRYT